MHHSGLSHFFPVLFCIQITSTASNPLGRDTTNISDKTYYKLGYKSNGLMALPRVASTFSIQKLARIEGELYNQVVTHCSSASNSASCSAAESYIQDYQETSLVLKNANPNANFTQVIAGNLNAIYRMIRRFREYIQPWILSILRHRVPIMDGHLVKKLKGVYNVSNGPNKIDMDIAKFAIALTHFQLDMKTEEIANGVFQGRKTGIKLTAIHCLEIGIHSIATGLYPVGIEWLEHALHKTKHGDNTTSELVVEEYLQRAIMKHDKDWRPENVRDMEFVFYEKPLNQTRESSERTWRKAMNFSRLNGENIPQKLWSLCIGNKEQVSNSKLFCWHENTIHPFWTLGPLKAELLSNTPNQIIQFHDIIGPEQTTKIRNGLLPKCIPAILSFFDIFYPRMNLGYVCRHKGEHAAIITKLGNLVVRVTGFRVGDSADDRHEPIELFSYAPGGYNSLHPDWTFSSLGVLSERMATFIIYLDAPDVGGSTVLPKLEVAVKPLKGSAVLFYNVHSSGERALKAIHGACPVVLGQKLVAVKWAVYHEQDHLVCDQDPKAALNYFGNGRAKSRVLLAKNV